MAIVVSGSSSYTPTGNQDVSTTGATIPLPSGLAVGDYVIAAVYYAQLASSTPTVVTPAGWTVINASALGTSSNRILALYGYKINNSSALTAIGTSFQAKAGATATRVVANVHRLTGVDLSATPSLGAIEFSASSATSVTFNQPSAGTVEVFFLGTNNASPSLPPVIGSTGGTVIVTNRSVANTGPTSDSQLSTFIGGTGATYSVATANHVSYGVGLTPLVASVVKTTTSAAVYATTKSTTITAPAFGNGLVAIIQHQASGAVTVTDSATNTWTRRAASENATPTGASNQFKVDVWDCLASAITTAPTSVTVTVTASSEIGVTVYEMTGVNWQASAQTSNVTSPQSGAPTITPAIGDLILTSLGYYASSNTATVGAPYTTVVGSGVTTTRYDSAYYAATAITASTPLWTVTGSSFGAGFASSSYGLAVSPISNIPPTASFTHSEAGVMTSVNSTSTDSDGTVVGYDWDWGDGSTHATTATASHAYAFGGTYSVVLIVTDNGGATGSTTVSITVTSSWLRKTIVQAPENGTVSHTVNFTAATAGNLLVALAAAGATSTTPTGWTLPANGSAVNFSGLYVWYKTATSGESSFTTTHNGSNYAAIFHIFEFPSNYTFAQSISATNQAPSSANPNLTGLTGTTSVFGVASADIPNSLNITSVSTTWSAAPQNPITIANSFLAPGTNDGYFFGLSYVDGYTGIAYQPSHATTFTGGTINIEVLTFALQVGTLPIAAFTHSETGLVTSVDGTSSSKTGGTIASYDWDWGDSTSHGIVATTTHTYLSAGTYTVTLTVTDNIGLKGIKTASVTIPNTMQATPHFATGDYAIATSGAATTITVAKPTNTSDGDLLVAYVYDQSSAGTSFTTIPTGWTLGYALSIRKGGIYTKPIASAAAETVTTYTWSGATSGRVVASIFRVTSADLTNPIDVVGTELTGDAPNATSITVPSLTPTLTNDLLLGFNYWNNSSPTIVSVFSAAPGMTDGIQSVSPTGGANNTSGTDIQYQYLTTTAATGTRIPTLSPSGVAVNGFLLTVRSATSSSVAGYTGIYRDSGGVNHSGSLFYWDGTAKRSLGTGLTTNFQSVTVSQFLSAAHAPWFAAHRGFSNNYPEETLYTYRSATDWGIKAIEISVQYSSDGTPWCFHDTTTTRTTGVSGTISSMTDTQLSVLSNLGSTASINSGQPSRPVAKLIDVLNVYYKTHVILIEDKTYTHTTTILNLLDSYGTAGRPATEIFIWKVDGLAGSSFYTAASSRGYHRWAYIFDTSMSGSFSGLVTSGKADMIGMDFNSSDATLTSAISACMTNGVMPTGHIITSTTQRDRLLGLGMKGLMMSNKDAVAPWYVLWSN